MSLAAFAQAVQSSGFGQRAGGSPLAYPIANTLHLLGLVMLVGGIGIVDLRLAGAFRALPPEPLSRALTPVALAGLALMLPTGAVMFAADAGSLAGSAVFRWKLALIAVALANAITFRLLWSRRLAGWDADPPVAGRLMAAASILLWLKVGALGRMIALADAEGPNRQPVLHSPMFWDAQRRKKGPPDSRQALSQVRNHQAAQSSLPSSSVPELLSAWPSERTCSATFSSSILSADLVVAAPSLPISLVTVSPRGASF